MTEANAAMDVYRFDQYAKACYDFFWRDFCDWYVEAIKPAMKDPARAGQTANVLAAVLDGALRLMHPMIPFITETVWWHLNEVRPTRGLPHVLQAFPSDLLVGAAWPTVTPIAAQTSSLPPAPSADVEQVFSTIQEIIGAIRNLRNQYNVNVKQPVEASILSGEGLRRPNRRKPRGDRVARDMQAESGRRRSGADSQRRPSSSRRLRGFRGRGDQPGC